jgi:hypothetical protein
VKYYCPNHSPGRWLDGPVCAECEAREGREAREAREAREKRATPPPRDVPKRGSEWSPPRTRRVEVPRIEVRRVEVPRVGDSTDEWRGADPDVPRPAPPISWRVELPPGVRALPVGGCLKRLAMLILLGLVLFGIATVWFFSSVIVSSIDAAAPSGSAWRTVAELSTAGQHVGAWWRPTG